MQAWCLLYLAPAGESGYGSVCVCSPYSVRIAIRRVGVHLSLALARSLAPLRAPSTQVPFLLHTLNHIPPAPAAPAAWSWSRVCSHLTAFTDADQRREVHVYTQHCTLTAIHDKDITGAHTNMSHLLSFNRRRFPPPDRA